MKEYRLNVDPRILELLGPNLYTNIYYVLAELIANAYDADASNVYIFDGEEEIRVEDDGRGMSYDSGEVAKFLNVAGVSRTNEDEAITSNGRRKMGRKGVGKLAALSVSESVDVLTVSDGEKSGFVLSRVPGGELLQAIPEESITFLRATSQGTAIVMRDPEYALHKTMSAVRRNLLKLFPIVSPDFRIHVVRGTDTETIDDFDRHVMGQLSTLITLGDHYGDLVDLVPDSHPARRSDLVSAEPAFIKEITMTNRAGETKPYTLELVGWIGTYKSTRELKAERTEFPDNFISLFANGKLGEFNVLPVVGQNRLSEVYVVGQLHADLFELTELPDMALSNRQGYKSDDPRYAAVLDHIRDDLLFRLRRRRDTFADLENALKKEKKKAEQLANEAKLRESVDDFRRRVAESASAELDSLGLDGQSEGVQEAISRALSEHSPDLGLKALVDSQKKKILLSHTGGDKPFADVIFQMLIHNGVPAEEILYTSSPDAASRIPYGQRVWDYLREFFVDSYSTEKVLVLFVTSAAAAKGWGSVLEVGAAWVTKKDHQVFNLHPHKPEHPLDVEMLWQTTVQDEVTKELSMTPLNADVLCEKIEYVCRDIGVKPLDRAANLMHLGTLVSIVP